METGLKVINETEIKEKLNGLNANSMTFMMESLVMMGLLGGMVWGIFTLRDLTVPLEIWIYNATLIATTTLASQLVPTQGTWLNRNSAKVWKINSIMAVVVFLGGCVWGEMELEQHKATEVFISNTISAGLSMALILVIGCMNNYRQEGKKEGYSPVIGWKCERILNWIEKDKDEEIKKYVQEIKKQERAIVGKEFEMMLQWMWGAKERKRDEEMKEACVKLYSQE